MLGLPVAHALGEDSPSWPMSAWKVRRTVGIPPRDPLFVNKPEMRGADCCYVSFPTGEFLQPDGRDLRVLIGGKVAQFKVVDVGFGGHVRLVASIPSGADRMTVYYGNPAAEELFANRANWEPQRGLWLETRRLPVNRGGDCNTLAGIRAAWDSSLVGDGRFGAGPVGNLFQGFNLFGPSDRYLSLYTGWLYVPKDSRITFAVLASDMGYLLVEDKLAAAKSEGGPMNPHRQYFGDPLLLREGIHPIKMYHVQMGGSAAAGAAWWMPGMPKGEKYLHFQIIPETAFAPLRYGRLLDYEVRGQPIGADFASVNDGDVLLDDAKLLVRFLFRDLSRPADAALKCQPLWEFGDGTSTESRDPNHVYLSPGDYTVTLTLRQGDRKFVERQRIRVGPGLFANGRAARREADTLEAYYPILKDYQVDRMSTPDLITAARIFDVLEKPEEIVAACSVLLFAKKRADSLDDATLVRHCLLLGRHLRDQEPSGEKAEKAIEVFTRAEMQTKDIHAKARLANEKGDVYSHYLNDLDKALREYTKPLTIYIKAADDQVRLAQIRVGDVYRAKGDYEAALKAYERAADMPIASESAKIASARRGSFAQTTEDCIRRKMFREAQAELDNWDWEFPTDKLAGYSSLLRAKVAFAEAKKAEAEKPADEEKKQAALELAKARTQEAVKQAECLLRVNKNSEYADTLLLFLTDLFADRGQLDKALEEASALLKDYPASALQEAAHLRRASLYLEQGKNAEAAKEALELAKSHEDSDNAPKALLLAATAQARQDKKADAVQTLERLTQKHPTAKEATEGLKMLKELRGK